MVKFSMAKNAEKPPLTMVDPAATGVPPPRKLGHHGLSLWNSVQNAYRIDDAGGIELLAQCLCRCKIAWRPLLRGSVPTARSSTPGPAPRRTRHCGTSWPDAPSSSGPWSGSGSTSKPSSRLAGRRRDGEGPMPTNRHPVRHSHRGRLNHGQDMILQYGHDERWAAFRSEAEHRDAWIRNRDRLLAWYRHGRRPQAWWQFEAPFRYPGYDREQSTLYTAGLLTAEELAELEAFGVRNSNGRSSRIFFIVRAPAGFSRASRPNGRTTNGRTFRVRSSSSGRSSAGAGAGPSASLRLRARRSRRSEKRSPGARRTGARTNETNWRTAHPCATPLSAQAQRGRFPCRPSASPIPSSMP